MFQSRVNLSEVRPYINNNLSEIVQKCKQAPESDWCKIAANVVQQKHGVVIHRLDKKSFDVAQQVRKYIKTIVYQWSDGTQLEESQNSQYSMLDKRFNTTPMGKRTIHLWSDIKPYIDQNTLKKIKRVYSKTKGQRAALAYAITTVLEKTENVEIQNSDGSKRPDSHAVAKIRSLLGIEEVKNIECSITRKYLTQLETEKSELLERIEKIDALMKAVIKNA